ncbi:hypothetical protein BDF20DRAFT_908815 [Mycotypha africana]|uniref:uncharacterized protein n=1 Tax=Mycotypha africana TaxID=64632 RepID=UPI0023001621|nr:uncharacterized protein BDF20DRAFT_908815 [Mycotypha africana]KAI8990994.1 hypothetical protein BDF20DRAFT_908815 [Mycotypha africana]
MSSFYHYTERCTRSSPRQFTTRSSYATEAEEEEEDEEGTDVYKGSRQRSIKDILDEDEDGHHGDVSALENYYPLLNETEYNDPFIDEFGRPITLTPPPIAMPPYDASYSDEFLAIVRQCVNKAKSSMPSTLFPTASNNNNNNRHDRQQHLSTEKDGLVADLLEGLPHRMTVPAKNSIGSRLTHNRFTQKDKGKQKMVGQQQDQKKSSSFNSWIDFDAFDTPKGTSSHKMRLSPPMPPQTPSYVKKQTKNRLEDDPHGLFDNYRQYPLVDDRTTTIEQGRRALAPHTSCFTRQQADIDPLLLPEEEEDEFFVLDKVPTHMNDLHYVSNGKFKTKQNAKNREKELMNAIDTKFHCEQEKAHHPFILQEQQSLEEEEEFPMDDSKDFSSWLCFDNDDEYASFKNFIDQTYGNGHHAKHPNEAQQVLNEDDDNVDTVSLTGSDLPQKSFRYGNSSSTKKKVGFSNTNDSLLPVPFMEPSAKQNNERKDADTAEQSCEKTSNAEQQDLSTSMQQQQQIELSYSGFKSKILRSSTPKRTTVGHAIFNSNSLLRKHAQQQEQQQLVFKGLFEDEDGQDDSFEEKENMASNTPKNVETTSGSANMQRYLFHSTASMGREQVNSSRRPLFNLTK